MSGKVSYAKIQCKKRYKTKIAIGESTIQNLKTTLIIEKAIAIVPYSLRLRPLLSSPLNGIKI